ncbi:hypothetical protein SAMN05428987_4991 [Paenibacillus sp. CF095]|nr:hypothetical protein SAMN05428987_4991 [Paenibacillus sp. CF095]
MSISDRRFSCISIHALHTECDETIDPISIILFSISIHALHTECDRQNRKIKRCFGDFNPRTPYGVRRYAANVERQTYLFQSTHSIRSATSTPSNPMHLSIHFNPRTPYGVRLTVNRNVTYFDDFNPRTPYGVRQRKYTY